MTEENVQCKKCLISIPETHINFNHECIFCSVYETKWGHRDYHKKQRKLIKILDYYRDKNKDGKYDCLVPLSGGKDSTYVLYLAKKKFGMRPLAVTFDNGLQTQLARENITKAVDNLNVDHIAISPSKDELRTLYREFFLKTKNMCTVCNHGINTAVCQTAANEGLELVLIGGVGKLENAPIYGSKRYCMEDIFRKVLSGSVQPEIIDKYCNKNIRKQQRINPVSIFNYFNYDYNEVLNALQSELGWEPSEHGDAKIDCRLYPAISYYKYKQNGVTSSMLMASALLRDKQISQSEYQDRIGKEIERLDNFDEDKLSEFHDFLGIEPEYLKKDIHILNYWEPALTEEKINELGTISIEKEGGKLGAIRKIFEIISFEIERDGGSIEIIDFQGNELKIKMGGDCEGCLQVDDTMVPYLESILRNIVSEDICVENVN